MLEQLVESKSNREENKTRGGFLLTTFVLIVGLCFSAVLWSLFAKDLGMQGESFDVSTLIAPVSENAPAPMQKQEKRKSSAAKSALPTRQANIMRIDEAQPAPDKISVTSNTSQSRPVGRFVISDQPEGGNFQNSTAGKIGTSDGDVGINVEDDETTSGETKNKIEPPPIIKKNPVEAKPKTILRSTGVINGKAKFLPKPVYSAAAKAVKAAGDVNVQVTIDEAGNVISANAINGHPLLRAEAERAARNAKFNPTLLSQQPVKVTGIIVYKFSMP